MQSSVFLRTVAKYNITHLMHDWEGNMKINSPMENHIARGQRPREYDFLGEINLHISRTFMQ